MLRLAKVNVIISKYLCFMFITAVVSLCVSWFRSLLWHNNSHCFVGDRHDSSDIEYSSHGARRQTRSRHSQVRLLRDLRSLSVPASPGSECGSSGTNGSCQN